MLWELLGEARMPPADHATTQVRTLRRFAHWIVLCQRTCGKTPRVSSVKNFWKFNVNVANWLRIIRSTSISDEGKPYAERSCCESDMSVPSELCPIHSTESNDSNEVSLSILVISVTISIVSAFALWVLCWDNWHTWGNFDFHFASTCSEECDTVSSYSRDGYRRVNLEELSILHFSRFDCQRSSESRTVSFRRCWVRITDLIKQYLAFYGVNNYCQWNW